MNAPWLKDWLEEIEAFPLGTHDDQIDNLSAGYALWDSQGNTDALYEA
jgi:phage terminase large subunit-like protein